MVSSVAKDLWWLKWDIFHLNIEWRFLHQVSYSIPKIRTPCTNLLSYYNQSWQWVSGLWVKWVNKFGWVTGQYPWPVDPFYIVLIRYPTWFSGSWKTSNGNQNCYFDCLLVPFHTLWNSVARDEQISLGRPKFCWNFSEERLTDVNYIYCVPRRGDKSKSHRYFLPLGKRHTVTVTDE